MSPGFKMAYEKTYNQTYPNEAVAPEDMTYKVPTFIPTQNLPEVTITAPDLSKTKQLNGITVKANPLAESVNRNKAKRRLTSNKGQLYQEGGPIERTDNTRVLHISNNGEAVYERTPVGYGDFLPLVGTYRAARRIDNGEPNASYGDLIVNGAMDLLGAGMIGPVIKAAGKAGKITQALKSKGFVPGSKEGIYIKQGATGTINRASGNVRLIPTVDYTNVALLPMIQTLRVPATAPFK